MSEICIICNQEMKLGQAIRQTFFFKGSIEYDYQKKIPNYEGRIHEACFKPLHWNGLRDFLKQKADEI